jgi:oligoribonuclease
MISPAPAPSRAPSVHNLVWIDLEMTGLDPGTDVILQAALVITTADLEPLAEAAVYIHQPEQALARMTPFVRDMHTRTGLIERVARSTTDLTTAERLLLERISAWCPAPATLCGNSVWADRRFIARYMPDLDRHLHYRIVDVSSVKVLAQRWYGASAVFGKPAAGEHDAVVDIRNSIAELRHYRRVLFRDSLGPQ